MDRDKINYLEEISSMMFGFGDCYRPNPDTVKVVENIVLKQLRTIIQLAFKHCEGDTLKGPELIFLLRHNKTKMRRFVKYLKNRRLKAMVQRTDLSGGSIDFDQKQPPDELLNFIEHIDETGEFMDLSEMDEVKYQRELRADRISQALDEKRYLEFHEARRATFAAKGTDRKNDRFRLWLDPKENLKFDPNALMILIYFAHQTVAEIVDLALLVRMDHKSDGDPFSHIQGSYYNSVMFNRKHHLQDEQIDYIQIYNTQTAISVAEVKEVMRRMFQLRFGKLNFGGRIPETHYLFAL